MSITAVPELQSSTMMLIGIAALGSVVFRRKLAACVTSKPRLSRRGCNWLFSRGVSRKGARTARSEPAD